jgi:DegV family protein with EDD domain
MSKIRIVTDSTACFEDASFAEDYNITVIPLNVHFGDQVYRDGIDLSPEEMFQRMRHAKVPARMSAPPLSAFETVYKDLCKQTDQIVVAVHSQQFTETFARAQAARMGLLGRCDITVIDSQTTSVSLGYLVQEIVNSAQQGAELEEIVRIARGVIPRLYSIYYVDSLDTIQRAGLIGRTQAILGAMLEIKPILTIEDGKLITMEKARTHSQAIEKMIEFIAEFTNLERLSILQNTTRITDKTRMLQDRLALEFSRVQPPVLLYEPLMATLIGPDAMGMAVLEGDGKDLID